MPRPGALFGVCGLGAPNCVEHEQVHLCVGQHSTKHANHPTGRHGYARKRAVHTMHTIVVLCCVILCVGGGAVSSPHGCVASIILLVQFNAVAT